jgi:hypothetical protein
VGDCKRGGTAVLIFMGLREIKNGCQSLRWDPSQAVCLQLLCWCSSDDDSVAFCSDTSCPIVVWTVNDLKEAQRRCLSC